MNKLWESDKNKEILPEKVAVNIINMQPRISIFMSLDNFIKITSNILSARILRNFTLFFGVLIISFPVYATVSLDPLYPIQVTNDIPSFQNNFNQNFGRSTQRNFEKIGLVLNQVTGISKVTDLTATGGLTVTNSIMRVQGSGGPVILTTNPQIIGGTDGQEIRIIGQSDVNTVKFVHGNGIQMQGGQNFTLGSGDVLTLIYDAGLGVYLDHGRENN